MKTEKLNIEFIHIFDTFIIKEMRHIINSYGKRLPAPAHAKLQTEVIKMIGEKEGLNYPQAMRKLKEYIVKVLGGSHKDKGVAYIDALQKVKDHLKK